MPHNLLALDQSSRTTGWAIFQDTKLITYGHFTLTDDNLDTRLVKFREKIIELINEYTITKVVYEDIQMQSNISNNVQTYKILAEVVGVLSETLTELNIPHESILAVVWKKNLNIKGTARQEQKKNAREYVINNYNKTPTEDEADAICIGISSLYHNKSTTELNWE